MISITNNTRGPLDFVVGVKNGEAVTDSVAAGETKNMDVPADDRTVVARVNAGMIEVGAARRGRAPTQNSESSDS